VALATPSTACALQISPASPVSKFYLDFVCFEKRIVIGIDGSQHASSERDTARAVVLAADGYQIARYWNNDVLQQPSAVLEDILVKLVGDDR
jgi:very-short-patch-repair endonuclease